MLYEMFTGRPPFVGNTLMHIMALQMSDDPPLPMSKVNVHLAISPELEQIIMRALAKNPDERHASMSELIDAINSVPRTALSQFPTPLMRRKDAMPVADLVVPVGGREAGRDPRLRETIDSAVVSQPGQRRPSPTPVWVKVALAVAGVLVFALGWAVSLRLFGGHVDMVLTVPPRPAAVATTDLVPIPAPLPSPMAVPSASPSVSVPPSALASASASAKPKPGAHSGRGPGAAAAEPPTPDERPHATALPTVEHCYETVGTVRREVPCP
jgi:serine/threonine-protein kinase